MGALDFSLPLAAEFTSDRVEACLDRQAFNTLWVTMRQDAASPAHNFSLPLLTDFQSLLHTIKRNGGEWIQQGDSLPVHYAVLKSAHPLYFNLGGDLNHFRECIGRRDSNGLYNYSKLCLDIMYDWATFANSAMTTIALVQGRALGGGFETALSADFIIAEEQSTFGFPEIVFGLFPCTGGMSLLARRVGVHQAEKMLTNERVYKAQELLDMGVIDEVCAQGEGEIAVEKFIAKHGKRRGSRMMLQRARHRMAPLDYEELHTVVEEWVGLAMRLSPAELRMMEMLSMMQRGAQSA
jgi:DSF synthase